MTSPETYTTVDIVAGVTVDIGRAPTPKGMQAGPPPLMVRIHGPDYPDGWFEAESDWSSVQLATVLSNRYIPSDVACACYEAGWRAERARADAMAAKLAEVSRPCGRCGGAGVYPYSQGEDGTMRNKLCECGAQMTSVEVAWKKPPAV